MTIQRFQSIVLRLSNQMFVRHYLYVNYPHEPQVMGIQFQMNVSPRRQQYARSCECGACQKCRHREKVRTDRVPLNGNKALALELAGLGFTWRDDLKLWAIDRTEESPCL